MQILIKNQAKEKALCEVAKFFEQRYPVYYKQCLDDMKELRIASSPGYQGGKDRPVYVKLKVPTVLWMACEAAIPGFGQDTDDVELFTKTLTALDGHAKLKATPCLVVPADYPKEPAAVEDPKPEA